MQQSDMNHPTPSLSLPPLPPPPLAVQRHTLRGPVTQFMEKGKQDAAT